MSKDNNFDFLRFLFALMVVISHSYALSGNDESEQWINQITDGQVSWSSIGLNGFFVISGYFIFLSMQGSSSIWIYFKKRILRVFPGLVGVLLISLAVIPFLHRDGFQLFKQLDYYTYFPFNLSLYGYQPIIKGVFETNYYHAINGSLWTIRYEFSLYIALIALYFIKDHKKWVQGIVMAFAVFMYLVFIISIDKVAGAKMFNLHGLHIFNLGTFFVMGSVLASIRFEKYVSCNLLFISVTLLFVSVYTEHYNGIKHLVFPIFVLCFGFLKLPLFSNFSQYGDMSYGIYIYSFPIQQTLMYFFNFNVYALLASSILISIIFGFLSWNLIEKKMLKFKKVD